MKNIVLYANAFPVASVSPDDDFAALKVSSAVQSALAAAERSGANPPKLVCVSEEREATGGIVTRESFTRLNPVTLAPKGKAVSGEGALANLLKGD